MDLISLVIILAVVGFVLYLINAYVPMDPRIRQLIVVVVIIALVLWILQAFGILGSLHSLRVG